ncbi:MAG: phosphate signaling complex protein PhoU [Candidatus Bathyarchaeota archaeon]|nr:phosphate signaling complex protein PhoU [Candidatus Bathyarchaeota archaeon]
MGRIIDSGLKELSAILQKMGELAYHSVLTTLLESFENTNTYDQVREMSNTLISMADQVEDKVFELIVRFQPVASDLRTIKSYMKIAYDFARFGRYALNISYINKRVGGIGNCDQWITLHLKEMGDKTLSMIKLSIDSLKNHNQQLAEKIVEKEKEVDKMYFNFLDKLIEKAGITTKCVVSSILVARYLERIADHTMYICKSIIYITTGQKATLR